MILAFDTYYFNNKANTVCIAFDRWDDIAPSMIYSELFENSVAYQSGEFYKRELPCIISLLKKISMDSVKAIIIDGYVYLDDEGKPGLGAYLHSSVDKKNTGDWFAKTNFMTLNRNKKVVLRGNSRRPLYVTAAGFELDAAAECIRTMSGEHRMPNLLKTLDTLTRQTV